MAKTLIAEPEIPQQDKSKQKRKKQARREAKVMLKIERAQKDVKKAQKKLTRVQSDLDEQQNHLQTLEEKLQQLRLTEETSSQETQPEEISAQEITSEEPVQNQIEVYSSSDLVIPAPVAIVEIDTTSPESSTFSQDEIPSTSENEGTALETNENASPEEEKVEANAYAYNGQNASPSENTDNQEAIQ